MDKFELRRQKLLEILEDQCGGRVADLAKRLGRSDSYVARMLYPESKAGRKRIGEDLADLIAQTFSVDRSTLELAQPEEIVARELQWVSQDERRLLSLFRATDDEGRSSILELAEVVPKVLLSGVVVRNKS